MVHPGDLPALTRSRIRALNARLHPEMCKSLARRAGEDAVASEADRILRHFFSKLAEVREMLWTDLDAAYEGDPAATSFEEIILAYPSLEAIAIQRLAHILYLAGLPLIPRMMTEWAHGRTGIDIHPGAQIGSHFFIDHGTGVVIGETTEDRRPCETLSGCLLIARRSPPGGRCAGQKRHPTVEDHVTIYAGTTVMGGDTVVGAGSTIGANVFLTHSVPPRSLVSYEEKKIAIVPKRPVQVDRRGGHSCPDVIYLDYNATTPLSAAAWRRCSLISSEHFGNPSSVHRAGRKTRAALDDARDRLAAIVRREAARDHLHRAAGRRRTTSP